MIRPFVTVTPASVESSATSSVLLDLMPHALMIHATVVLKAGVDNFVKRKDVPVCSTSIVLDVVPVTALLRRVTATQDGLVAAVKNLLAPVPQCAEAMVPVIRLDSHLSVLVIKGGWVELVRLNVNTVLPKKQAMVYSSVNVMIASVVYHATRSALDVAIVQIMHATVDLKAGEVLRVTRKAALAGDLTALVMAHVLPL